MYHAHRKGVQKPEATLSRLESSDTTQEKERDGRSRACLSGASGLLGRKGSIGAGRIGLSEKGNVTSPGICRELWFIQESSKANLSPSDSFYHRGSVQVTGKKDLTQTRAMDKGKTADLSRVHLHV